MNTPTYLTKSKEEQKVLVDLARSCGFSAETHYGHFQWIVISGYKKQHVGWNSQAYEHKVVTRQEFAEYLMANIKAPLIEVPLSPIKGQYSTAEISKTDKTVTVGCCVYPFSDIQLLMSHIS